jgi:hypothetical protein
MDYRPGMRLRSQVCSTEVIVVRAPSRPLDLSCGGVAMVAMGAEGRSPSAGPPKAGLDTGTTLGKRYTSTSDDLFEVLVTRAGAGTLEDASGPLVAKDARALPASD